MWYRCVAPMWLCAGCLMWSLRHAVNLSSCGSYNLLPIQFVQLDAFLCEIAAFFLVVASHMRSSRLRMQYHHIIWIPWVHVEHTLEKPMIKKCEAVVGKHIWSPLLWQSIPVLPQLMSGVSPLRFGTRKKNPGWNAPFPTLTLVAQLGSRSINVADTFFWVNSSNPRSISLRYKTSSEKRRPDCRLKAMCTECTYHICILIYTCILTYIHVQNIIKICACAVFVFVPIPRFTGLGNWSVVGHRCPVVKLDKLWKDMDNE